MSNDRKLLELAAKAAGLDVIFGASGPGASMAFHASGVNRTRRWDPIGDDGDALRLAVTIGFSIITEPFYVRIHSIKDVFLVREEVLCDGFAATRRAIVRAAAEIGKAMP